MQELVTIIESFKGLISKLEALLPQKDVAVAQDVAQVADAVADDVAPEARSTVI